VGALTPEARVSVRVQPGAAKEEIAGFADGVLRVRVAATPVKGKANTALVRLLAKTLGISTGQVSIIKGATSRNKVVAVEGLTAEEVLKKLGVA